MQSPMPIAVAAAQLSQAMSDLIEVQMSAKAQIDQALADFTKSYDAAMAKPAPVRELAHSTILVSLRDLEKRGWTDTGRKSLLTAIETTRALMGIEQ